MSGKEPKEYINFFNVPEGGEKGARHCHQCKTDADNNGITSGIIPVSGNTIKGHFHGIRDGVIGKTLIGRGKDHAHALPKKGSK